MYAQAVSKVLIAPTTSNLRFFGTERDTTKKLDKIARYLEDLAILICAYLTNSTFSRFKVTVD